MKKTLLLLLALLICGIVSAQNLQDVIYLKNGSVIRGTLIEQVPSVKIRTSDGSIWVFEDDQIDHISAETKTQQTNSQGMDMSVYAGTPEFSSRQKKQPRSAGSLSRGLRMLCGFSYQQHINQYTCSVLDADVSVGYQLTPKWYAGLGLGDQIYFDYWYYGYYDVYPMPVAQMPVFLNIRYDAKPSGFSPMADFRFGYSVTADELVDYSGMYINPSLGIRYNRLSFSVGVEMVKLAEPWSFMELGAANGDIVDVNYQTSIQFRFVFEWGAR